MIVKKSNTKHKPFTNYYLSQSIIDYLLAFAVFLRFFAFFVYVHLFVFVIIVVSRLDTDRVVILRIIVIAYANRPSSFFVLYLVLHQV